MTGTREKLNLLRVWKQKNPRLKDLPQLSNVIAAGLRYISSIQRYYVVSVSWSSTSSSSKKKLPVIIRSYGKMKT